MTCSWIKVNPRDPDFSGPVTVIQSFDSAGIRWDKGKPKAMLPVINLLQKSLRFIKLKLPKPLIISMKKD
jgi:hypothetical protein